MHHGVGGGVYKAWAASAAEARALVHRLCAMQAELRRRDSELTQRVSEAKKRMQTGRRTWLRRTMLPQLVE